MILISADSQDITTFTASERHVTDPRLHRRPELQLTGVTRQLSVSPTMFLISASILGTRNRLQIQDLCKLSEL